ncbi:cysteine--tRNA ligase [Candidatus Saccharibacteria bacterium]|nr:cysteine--tRNA ligase [Candidatus Saccharibacteria bacterium]
MRLFDTAQKQYIDFTPTGVASIYTCGITPYDSAHLGHILTFMTYDLLQRRLEDTGLEVRLVRNITDVDEPIYKKAAELGVDYRDLAAQETELFQKVLRQLNLRPAYAEPKASEYIGEMAAAVKTLVDNNYGYKLDEDIYFDTTKLASFGSFSGFSDRLLHNFMAVRGGDPMRLGKRSPLDFLLWRGISDLNDPAAWDSVIGRGRPGWHIECTVMAEANLGTPFDLHGGGDDLIFPHHECEIAQSIGLGQAQMARHWMHIAPLLYAGEKMSKSLGNLVFAKDLLTTYEPAVIRLALMRYHYRTGGEWQPEFLDHADELWTRLQIAGSICSPVSAQSLLNELQIALDDDLDTHRIIHALEEFAAHNDGPIRDCDVFSQAMRLLGLIA